MILDLETPNFSGSELDTPEGKRKILGQLFQLQEQLKYVLANLDEENFSDEVNMVIEQAKGTPDIINSVKEQVDSNGVKTKTAIKQVSEAIILEAERAKGEEGTLKASITVTADAITQEVSRATQAEGTLKSRIDVTAEAITQEVTRATQAEGTLSSSIRQTAESITQKVGKNEIISMINQTAETITIMASKIRLEGLTTINNNFSIDTAGNVMLKSGNLVVSMTSTGLKIESPSYTCYLSDGGISVRSSSGAILMQGYPSSSTGYVLNVNGSIVNNGNTMIHAGNIGNYTVGHANSSGVLLSSNYDSAYISVNGNFIPGTTTMWCGTTGNPWVGVAAMSGSITTSDSRKKLYQTKLGTLPKFLSFAKMVVPMTYKLINGTSDRWHIGFIAQEIEEAMAICGITSQEFAGLVKAPIYERMMLDEEGKETNNYDETSNIIDYNYFLRYDEFIPLTWLYMNDLESRLTKLEGGSNGI